MLKTLDILIGVATVMLLFSMVVTVVTQFIISAIGSRGRNLKNGLAGLLKQLDPTLRDTIAKEISTALLRHPLTKGRLGALGTVIHREEFSTLLMELASGQSINQLSTNAKGGLNQLLKNNGIDDPANTLKNVRNLTLQLENSNPELANDVRHSMAILQEAKSEFVGKIHAWFDQTIDRVSQRFTFSAHAITFFVALVVAFAIQLDTIALVNRLSSDDAFRAAVADQVPALIKDAGKQALTGPGGSAPGKTTPASTQSNPSTNETGKSAAQTTGAPQGQNSPQTEAVAKGVAAKTDKNQAGKNSAHTTNDRGEQPGSQTAGQTPSGTSTPQPNQGGGSPSDNQGAQAKIYKLLETNGVVAPTRGLIWQWDWLPLKIDWQLEGGRQLLGILISALLLSLGAPFWFNALQNLLRLRSALAQKDDQQRQTRQTTQTDGTSAGDGSGPPLPSIIQGEQGNLQAMG